MITIVETRFLAKQRMYSIKRYILLLFIFIHLISCLRPAQSAKLVNFVKCFKYVFPIRKITVTVILVKTISFSQVIFKKLMLNYD